MKPLFFKIIQSVFFVAPLSISVATNAAPGCPVGVELGEPKFVIGQLPAGNEVDRVEWMVEKKFDFFNESVPRKDKMKQMLQEVLKNSDSNADLLKKRYSDFSQAVFMDEIGRDLAGELNEIRSSFIEKCCPISEMSIRAVYRIMPDPRSTRENVLPKRPRIVGLAVGGCPPEKSSNATEKMIDTIDRACNYLVHDGEEFNSTQIETLLLGCARKIHSYAPVETAETLKKVISHSK